MAKSSRHSQRAFLQFLPLERRDLPSGVRSIDGTGNNLAHPTWGSTGVELLRRAPTTYADGLSAPSAGRPNPREISNAVVDQGTDDVFSRRGLAAMAYVWGQFIDHDLDLTVSASPSQSFNITVPAGDAYFTPGSSMPVRRSAYNPATGTTNARQQVNSLSAFLDGSQIYGSDAVVADKLRTHSGGRLKSSVGDMLPINDATTFPTGPLTLDNNAHIVPDSELFAAGDVRVNENIELTSLHTLFMREHNRVADHIHLLHPNLSDEAVYQKARAWVIAELEAITYNEWLPTILGPAGLNAYHGYLPHVNPGIANEFSTAGFRVGHSMLGDDVEFLGDDGLEITEQVPLSAAFFNPILLADFGIDSVLKYVVSDPASEIDNTIVNSVRNFLFGPPGAGGFDLASLNIQRGRDHGLADYNSARVAYGLPAVTSFAQITSNAALRQELQALYGTVNNIDLWVGMLAENHVPGGNTGPLVARIMVDQFTRIRDGDRFWYERTYSGAALHQLRNTTLADVIRRNTGLVNLQSNVFTFKVSISGTVFHDRNQNGIRNFNDRGIAGRTLQLINGIGNTVIDTTVSGPRGAYSFDVLDGLGVGRFLIRQVLPTGVVETTPAQPILAIQQGDTFIRHVNFGNAHVPPLPAMPFQSGSTTFANLPNGSSLSSFAAFQQEYLVEML